MIKLSINPKRIITHSTFTQMHPHPQTNNVILIPNSHSGVSMLLKEMDHMLTTSKDSYLFTSQDFNNEARILR